MTIAERNAAIVEAYGNGATMISLAKKYGLGKTRISAIIAAWRKSRKAA